MKILMLNPPWVKDFCRSARWAAKSRGRVQRHPDWMLIAAAVLEKAGHEVLFIDGPTEGLERKHIKKAYKNFKPELIVLHTTTPSIYNDISYAKMAKEILKCKTVMVGPHVTAVPDDTFSNAKGCLDAICRGEYDYTLKELASGMKMKDILGISYFDGKKVVHNKNRPYLDVNELPFPAWHQINPKWYWDAGKLYPFLTLISGRGCFGQCTFCQFKELMYKNKIRMRDPKLVVDEMEDDLRQFPYIKEIMIETDTFTAVPKHVKGVCDEIIKRGLHKKIKWSCNVRVDVDLKLLPLMKKAGCRMLMVGFEFGYQRGLDVVKKGTTVSQSRRFAKEAARLGFIIHGCFMIGAPEETRKEALKTIAFAKSLPLDTIQISGICTYPGTSLYDWAKEKGYLVPKDWRDWISKDYEQVTLLSYPQLSKDEIDSLIDRGLREFYLRPKQVLRMIGNIRSIEDVKRKIYGFRRFLEYMVK